jgi:alpha-tubulin suppressor-like RCC1 family protein
MRVVSAGAEHTCGVDTAGAAWCWGSNKNGQLGVNWYAHERKPKKVSSTRSFSSVAAGQIHSCGVDTTGAVWCWGQGTTGAVADGVAKRVLKPTETKKRGRSVVVGSRFTCVTGPLVCWGRNTHGEVAPAKAMYEVSKPVALSAVGTVDGVYATASFACATASTQVRCWGRNDQGQLGDGTLNRHRLGDVVTVGGVPLAASTVAVGWNHACAVAQGAVWCWGRNDAYQLGDGTRKRRVRPVEVRG